MEFADSSNILEMLSALRTRTRGGHDIVNRDALQVGTRRRSAEDQVALAPMTTFDTLEQTGAGNGNVSTTRRHEHRESQTSQDPGALLTSHLSTWSTKSDILLRDISSQAIWTTSSSKHGNGVEFLFDNNPNTFWQSDGAQPHSITAFFYPGARIVRLDLLLNHSLDESYAPQIISIRVGTGHHDLVEVCPPLTLEEPDGWLNIPLSTEELLSVTEAQRERQRESGQSREEREDHVDNTETNAGAVIPGAPDEYTSPTVVSPLGSPGIMPELLSSPVDPGVDNIVSQGNLEFARDGRDNYEALETDPEVPAKRDSKEELGASRGTNVTSGRIKFRYVHVLQIQILANHQNGRDCHIRGIRAIGAVFVNKTTSYVRI